MTDSSIAACLDFRTLARSYLTKDCSPRDIVRSLNTRIQAYPDPTVWIHRVSLQVLLTQSRELEQRRAAGEALPLFGVPFAVKDNVDVAGLPTTAACPAFTYVPNQSAPVVRRLQEAGALVIGKTNLDQLGSGLAGDRSPYGACHNVFNPDYISGGSSSGSAVAVAAGLVSFALGTDTAGSGRVPAGCNNIIGLKPTPGLLSNDGLVPACRSLDTVSFFALTAEDAFTVFDLARTGRPTVPLDNAAIAGFDFALPRPEDLEFFGDDGQAELFRKAVLGLEAMGGRRHSIDLQPFREVAALLYEGPWLAERRAGALDFLIEHAADLHPVTRAVLDGGMRYTAVDVFQGLARLKALAPKCLAVFDQADILLVPTLPTIPTLAETQADSIAWSRRLGYYTNFVNLLGLAAVSVPAGFTARGLPGGFTLIGPPGRERFLCELALLWQRHSNLPLGATGRHLSVPRPSDDQPAYRPLAPDQVRVAVAGAHLRGQPLHPDLRRTGARFVRTCRTAARYRFAALLDLKPPRPGLIRDDRRPGAVSVEIYDLPYEGFGKLVASVAPPLAIGTIELEDGEAVKGFLCESWAAARARDITDFGGWVAFLSRRTDLAPPVSSGKESR
jgi:allophanate hydrolase